MKHTVWHVRPLCSRQGDRLPGADTRRQVVKFGAGQPHTQRREGLLEDSLHHRHRPTPMGAGQCTQHRCRCAHIFSDPYNDSGFRRPCSSGS